MLNRKWFVVQYHEIHLTCFPPKTGQGGGRGQFWYKKVLQEHSKGESEEIRFRIKTSSRYMSSCTNSGEAFAKAGTVEFLAQFLIYSRTQQEGRVTADITVQMFRSTSVCHNRHLKWHEKQNADSDAYTIQWIEIHLAKVGNRKLHMCIQLKESINFIII